MTDIVNPSFERNLDSFLMSGTVDGLSPIRDYVVSGTNSPTRTAEQEPVSTSNLNAFQESSTSSSLDVTLDGGEAYIFGTWIVRDSDTTLTLDSSTAGQTIYAGWKYQNTDTIIIGKDELFQSTDPKIPLWEFDTDSTGVTNVTDLRELDVIVLSNTVELGKQASNSNEAVRYDQFTGLESTVSGKADDPHGNAAHSTNYAPDNHDNTAHSENYQTATEVDSDIASHTTNDIHDKNQPPQDHTHSSSGDGGSNVNLSSGDLTLPEVSSDSNTSGNIWIRTDL